MSQGNMAFVPIGDTDLPYCSGHVPLTKVSCTCPRQVESVTNLPELPQLQCLTTTWQSTTDVITTDVITTDVIDWKGYDKSPDSPDLLLTAGVMSAVVLVTLIAAMCLLWWLKSGKTRGVELHTPSPKLESSNPSV